MLKTRGLPPAPNCQTSWQTSASALGAIAAADFFTTDVWTWQGLVTFHRQSRLGKLLNVYKRAA